MGLGCCRAFEAFAGACVPSVRLGQGPRGGFTHEGGGIESEGLEEGSSASIRRAVAEDDGRIPSQPRGEAASAST
jgi:hypothetical protein